MRKLLVAPLLFVFAFANAGTPLPDGPHVVVAGEGKVTTKPDSARVRFSFEDRAQRPLPAKQAVDTGVNRLLEGLAAFGVEDRDITASALNASEDVDYNDAGKRVSNGFSAERTVTVVLKDLEKFNELLDYGLGTGADEIAGIEFESTRAKELRAEARNKAVENARSKASDVASAFGGKLGAIYSINSVNSSFSEQYGATTLDRIQVSGSRVSKGRYIQPTVEYVETVNAVYDLVR
jgi:uncharacterized protein YggE